MEAGSTVCSLVKVERRSDARFSGVIRRGRRNSRQVSAMGVIRPGGYRITLYRLGRC